MTNYSKPQIISSVQASVAIKNPVKAAELNDNGNIGSPSAYEADE